MYRRSGGSSGSCRQRKNYSPAVEKQKLTVRVARTIEDFMRIVTVRGAVYMAEQECPYEEEFDGNDFSATIFSVTWAMSPQAACVSAISPISPR